ncbi:early boundary activity protein 3 [Scaptodrosophila lebanonensis]|uniref:Early boundary activity protein 3 n=1 Tax=Drosophila lebanonensis TaxID=7225 RepID=A0A6J2U4I6_DROLE|nr:early boundary activity protein 3 [Scaptodrosophila lebanonensis]
MSNISNDSGLDDSAHGGHGGAAAAAAATRMSWFLAEVDEGSLKNGRPTGRTALCVLHSMELVESDVSDKYMTRFVEFRMNNTILEAKLILAADERKLVDAALVAMSKERRSEAEEQLLLVQYCEDNGKRLVHKLVPQHKVTWLSTNKLLKGTAVVKLENGCLAHILYAYEQRDRMEKVLLHLKARCFDHAFDEQLEAEPLPMNKDTWLLVQYSPEPELVVYEIIKYSETVWQQENDFKDVIAYMQLPGSELVMQAVVISYSTKHELLEAKYEELQRFALGLEIPVIEELERQLEQGGSTTSLFSRSTLFQQAQQRDTTGEHKQLQSKLELMTEKAQQEAQMIIEAFDMVDNINRNLQSQIGHANQPEATSSH